MTDIPTSLAQAIADAQRLHTETHREADRAARHDERMGLIEHLEDESVETIKEMLGPILSELKVEGHFKDILDKALNPQHPAVFALLIPVLAAVGYVLANAAAAGPVSTLAMSSQRKWGSYPLDPSMMAAAYVRGKLTRDDAFNRAEDSGVSDAKFVDLAKASRGTLTSNEALALWRLKRIEEPDAREIMLHNGLENDDINLFETLRWLPIDFATAVNAATQSQITREQLEYLMEQNGVDPTWADVVFKTAGMSPPVEMTLELWNRGLIDEATVDKIVLESPLKNEYVPVIKLMRHKFPALEQTTTLMRKGVFTLEEGKDAIRKLGYEPSLADKIAESIVQGGGSATKSLTPSVILDLYEVGRFTSGDAHTNLTALGYDATEADLLIFLADEKKAHSAIERAATSIGTRYVSWKIDRAEAGTLLDRVNYPATQRDELLDIWDARREAQTLHLSEAFLHKAYTKNKITREEVLPRLLAMGYEAIDAALVMETDFAPIALTAKQRDLTRADEVKRYTAGIITKPVLHSRLVAMGYDATEADQIIELVDHKLAEEAPATPATNGA